MAGQVVGSPLQNSSVTHAVNQSKQAYVLVVKEGPDTQASRQKRYIIQVSNLPLQAVTIKVGPLISGIGHTVLPSLSRTATAFAGNQRLIRVSLMPLVYGSTRPMALAMYVNCLFDRYSTAASQGSKYSQANTRQLTRVIHCSKEVGTDWTCCIHRQDSRSKVKLNTLFSRHVKVTFDLIATTHHTLSGVVLSKEIEFLLAPDDNRWVRAITLDHHCHIINLPRCVIASLILYTSVTAVTYEPCKPMRTQMTTPRRSMIW
jgi:hypothetical protein